MKIVHVISSIDSSGGGPSRSVTHLLSSLSEISTSLIIALHTARSQKPILEHFKEPTIALTFYESKMLGMLKNLEKELTIDQPNLFHGQAIWDLPVHQMAKTARRLNVPYIITPRGMLEPWSLLQKKTKKQLALKFYQYKDLRLATCLHATAPMEADSIRALGLKNPIAVIPNGVPLEDFELKDFNKFKASKKILFLSRIHPKKGIELLIEAWCQLPIELTKDWSIDIIGNGDPLYIKNLINSITQKGLSNSIHIKAPMYGKEKIEAYQNAQLFVLPTYSENFGIVVAEALACGTPVITTKGTPWEDLETYQCGWWVNVGVDALKATLEEALVLPDEQWEQMGKNGRQLIEDKYSMHAVAEQMFTLYEWIVEKKSRPAFVRMD
ncbi:Glycosyltransferase involved in cell wall bisynthesis [Maribacter orientalis]|uniref:Glycosyltransferase involved in cell wall bisynthesis n=1 Tax=Maribacter orientalis TaxID=228957 RepID=A0A1H7NA70_9FLAO|nr:glycosyltransferase [Maribacter orientalis]SEL19835.1 Glycosyltransferase involved in cell wall bisynthesis [Maribacter orientalis]